MVGVVCRLRGFWFGFCFQRLKQPREQGKKLVIIWAFWEIYRLKLRAEIGCRYQIWEHAFSRFDFIMSLSVSVEEREIRILGRSDNLPKYLIWI